MSTIRKELEFPAPPEGWEVEGYGLAEPGEIFLDSDGKWKPCGERLKSLYFFVARKKQSPAEWANAQLDLAALARVFPMGTLLRLGLDGRHVLQGGSGGCVGLHWVGAPAGDAQIHDGKWVDFQ